LIVSNQLAKQLLDAAPDPTVIVDQCGTIVYANDRVTDVLGYGADEIIGKPVEALLPERYRQHHRGHRDGFFSNAVSRPMGFSSDLYALRKDGEEIPVAISLSPVQTDDGLLVSSAIRDISATKEVQRQLVEADRAKSRFLAAASHDLRQPIQTLNLLNRAARSKAADPMHLTIIEKQQKSLDSMANLLNSLLDISKLEAGVVTPDISDCEVQKIFESLRAEFEDQAQNKGLEFMVDRCHGVARSDPQLLTQILGNLVSNAIRYTREGFVRLRCVHHDQNIRIQVVDSGLGIPADNLAGIFEEYRQVTRDDASGEGLGLGLSIVKRTADLLECPLEVESAPGKGSVFSVTVPEGDETLPQVAPKAVEAKSTAAGGLILVVDDERAVVDATQMLLESENFDVLVATSVDEAVTCIENNDQIPDLLIADYHLKGGRTGVEVVNAVRQSVARKLPVIIISGDTSERVAVADLTDTVFFKKPVDADELLRRIRNTIASADRC
jgi:PAS domain S-box-containing protein